MAYKYRVLFKDPNPMTRHLQIGNVILHNGKPEYFDDGYCLPMTVNKMKELPNVTIEKIDVNEIPIIVLDKPIEEKEKNIKNIISKKKDKVFCIRYIGDKKEIKTPYGLFAKNRKIGGFTQKQVDELMTSKHKFEIL